MEGTLWALCMYRAQSRVCLFFKWCCRNHFRNMSLRFFILYKVVSSADKVWHFQPWTSPSPMLCLRFRITARCDLLLLWIHCIAHRSAGMYIQTPVTNSYYPYRLKRTHRRQPILVPLKCHSCPGELHLQDGQLHLVAQVYPVRAQVHLAY